MGTCSKRCPSYCGVACVDGFCPAALHYDYPDIYEKITCKECWHYEGCSDCCVAYYQGITEEQCRKDCGLD